MVAPNGATIFFVNFILQFQIVNGQKRRINKDLEKKA